MLSDVDADVDEVIIGSIVAPAPDVLESSAFKFLDVVTETVWEFCDDSVVFDLVADGETDMLFDLLVDNEVDMLLDLLVDNGVDTLKVL
ncbi:hypothetical protein C0995_011375, partial [Termitomyces sp. Mi166